MTITLPTEIEVAVQQLAYETGTTAEAVVVDILRDKLRGTSVRPTLPFEPRDEWEAKLLSIGTPCGVSLSDEAFSREELYD